MNPPDSVKIGPYTYRLEPNEDIVDADKIGDCDEAKTLIRYATKNLDPIVLRSVLLHEVLHACALTAGIDTVVKLDQETLIRRMEPIVLGVLRDNPAFVQWLTSEKP